jgi:hypothetical protein
MTEVRVVDPNTGGAKGSKPARFDLIPPDVLWELAEHYGKGEEKYPSPEPGVMNWQLGYNWSLSYAALQRHLFLWSKGEDIDAETGTHHLIAVAWHAFCLRWFQEHGRGTDDIGGRVHARRDGGEDRMLQELVFGDPEIVVVQEGREASAIADADPHVNMNDPAMLNRRVRYLEYQLADAKRVIERTQGCLDQAKNALAVAGASDAS